MEYLLTMTFLTSTGTKTTLTLNNVKSTITSEEASTLMDKIIEKNIFLTKAGALVGKAYAQVTERKITKYDYN